MHAQAEAYSQFSIGLLAQATGDSATAFEHLNTAIRLDSNAEEPYHPAVSIALILNQPDDALRLAHQLNKKKPNELQSLLLLAEVYAQTDQPEQAETILQKATSDFSENPKAHLNRARFYLSQKKLEKALSAFEKARTLLPEDLVLARQIFDLSIHTEAYDRALEISEILPNNERLRILLGMYYLQEEQYEKAYTAFKHISINSPNTEWAKNPVFLVNLIIAAQKTDRHQEAVNTLTSTYTNSPTVLNQYIHPLLIGESHISIQSAINLLHDFHQKTPKETQALYYLIQLHAEKKDYETALKNAKQFETLAKEQKNTDLLNGLFYYKYAALNEQLGELEEAQKNFFKVIELGEPGLIEVAQNHIAYMWAERGEKLELGLRLIEQALAVEPENPAYLDTLGWIYYKQERYTEALAQLETAVKIYSEDPIIWEHLGDTHLKLGNPTAATEHWKKALEISPEAEHLHKRINENAPFNNP